MFRSYKQLIQITISVVVATYNSKSNLSCLVKLFSFCLYPGSYVLKLLMEACLSIKFAYHDWLTYKKNVCCVATVRRVALRRTVTATRMVLLSCEANSQKHSFFNNSKTTPCSTIHRRLFLKMSGHRFVLCF